MTFNPLKNIIIILVTLLFLSTNFAHASLILNFDNNGQLHGIEDVSVYNNDKQEWVYYDVLFVDGKFEEVFGSLTPKLAASDFGKAFEFSYALKQVFEDNTLLNSNTSIVNGCSDNVSCGIYSPFEISLGSPNMPSFVFSSLFKNNANIKNDHMLLGSWRTETDMTNSSKSTWAKWSLSSERTSVTVPEPKLIFLFTLLTALFLRRVSSK